MLGVTDEKECVRTPMKSHGAASNTTMNCSDVPMEASTDAVTTKNTTDTTNGNINTTKPKCHNGISPTSLVPKYDGPAFHTNWQAASRSSSLFRTTADDGSENNNVITTTESNGKATGSSSSKSTNALQPPPSGVINIDNHPHQCCPHSLTSHVGYSYLTSTKRCPCLLDSNHLSCENLTEVYMGSYAQDRFGSGEDIKRGEWGCEKRWLEMKQGEVDGRKRIEMEDNLIVGLGVSAKGKKSGKRSISPTSPVVSPENELALSSDSTVSVLPLPSDKTTSSSSTTTPTTFTLPNHLDYITRQPHLTTKMRSILMDWLIELGTEYKLHSETLHLSCMLVDRALSCSYESGDGMFQLKKDRLQCVGW